MTKEQMLTAALGVLAGVVTYLAKKVYERLLICEKDRKELWEEQRKMWLEIANLKDNFK